MKKSKVFWLFVSSSIFSVLGYLFTKSYTLGICLSNKVENLYDASCHALYSGIGNPLFYGMGALAIVFLTLIFVPNAANAWKKFAKWYIPIATLIFIFYPQPGSGDLFSPYPEQVYQWLSGAYVAISALILIFKRKDSNSV